MLKLVAITIAVEALVLLSFILGSQSSWGEGGKTAAVLIGLLAGAAMSIVAGTQLSFRDVISFAGLVALGDTSFFEVLAFAPFRGLAKDVAFLSAAHASKIVVSVGLLFVGHLLPSVITLAIRRKPATGTA